MNNIPAVLIANGTAVALLTVVLLSSGKTVHSGLFDHKLFLMALFCSMCQSVAETASFLIDGHPGLQGLNLGINVFLYSNNIVFAFIWTLYADYKLFSDIGRLKRVYRFVAIPALIVLAGTILNLFTPVFFWITAQNVYERTALYIIPVLITYFYMAYGVILVFFHRDKVKRYLFMPVVIFITPIFIGTLLQFCFYGYSLVGIGTAIGLTSVYINVQNEVSLIDPLTGLFTRQYLMRYLSALIKGGEGAKQAVGIMLDIDRFKQINDTYGHVTGDEALRTAGALIRSCVSRQAVAARYAGDEFIIVVPDAQANTGAEIIGRIAGKAEAENASGRHPYTLRFSCGCSAISGDDTVETFLRRIDAAMYESKKQNHQMKRRSTD